MSFKTFIYYHCLWVLRQWNTTDKRERGITMGNNCEECAKCVSIVKLNDGCYDVKCSACDEHFTFTADEMTTGMCEDYE